jgi:AcrR family transcriptional regulator
MENITDKKELLQKFRTQGILAAARKVIARKGLAGTTMEQVAEEAGISKATIYLYFKNKEALYSHCVIAGFDAMLECMRQASAQVRDPVERLRVLLDAQASSLEMDRDFFRVFLTERVSQFLDQSTEFGQEFARRQQEHTSMIAGVLRQAAKKGLIKEVDPEKGAYLLFSMLRGMSMFKLVNGDDTPLSEETGLILDIFLNGAAASRG